MTTKQLVSMDDLLAEASVEKIIPGDIVQGEVISVRKHEILVDLGPRGIGVVMRREIGFNQVPEVGAEISASVVDSEMDDGSVLLSLRKAAKDRGWDDLQKLFEEQQIIEIKPYDANRGGLLIELEGIRGFMPVSQLSADHYPRVSGADKDEILQRLNSLVGQGIRVRILDVNRKENKLIFSEKEAIKDDMQERFQKLAVGDEVEGVITGVVDFGAFVNVAGIEGLIHISEISWDRVENPADYVKVGQTVNTKIIAIDKDRLSLSLKQMSEDPWMKEVEKYKAGDEVEGSVTRITPFGAFVQISPAVEALVHISELGKSSDGDPEKLFKLGEKKQFTILDIDKETRRISLSLK